MFDKIRAGSGGPASDSAPALGATRSITRANPAAATRSFTRRRLVSGIVVGRHAIILSSLIADWPAPAATGPVVARLVARDRHGRTLSRPRRDARPAQHTPNEPPPVPCHPPGQSEDRRSGDPAEPPRQTARAAQRLASPTARTLHSPAPPSLPNETADRALDRIRPRPPRPAIDDPPGTPRDAGLADDHDRNHTARGDPPSQHARRGTRLSLRLLISDGFNTSVVNTRPIQLSHS